MPQNLNHEAKSTAAISKKFPELGLLNIFVGKWYLDGYNGVNSSAGIGQHVTGEDDYAWSEDKQSLMFSWSRQMGSEDIHGEGISLFDLVGRHLVSHTRDEHGKAKTFRTSMNGRTLTLRGDSERATIKVNIDEMMTINWEQRTDSKKWVPLCELRGSRNRQIFS